jgi:peptide/nickel transport system substrate-binding protein
MQYRLVLIATALTMLASCAPGQSPSSSPSGSEPAEPRTQVLAHRYEVSTLAPKIAQNNGPTSTTRLFNATLSLIDDQGLPRPYLADALPRLHTDTWRVFPDGRMETIYALRDGLTWQDGTPLTADDFAFAYRVYSDPGLGVFSGTPQNVIAAVLASDPRTVVVQWRSPNPGAGNLTFEELDPLPAHLLETAFDDYTHGRVTGDDFLGDPFWHYAYVGAGPYRLERWDPGSGSSATRTRP